ncbi:MAG: UDP-N-acetylmuramoyl-tripeptide--D-alanyl-D-alanine ligase [Gallionella sp.]|nr:UDP-N-acetylmuramoyl-tripeptide--D-alanyl-D-alanine ligase [Gallionella sp.]
MMYLSGLVQALAATLRGEDAYFTRVSTDTRKVESGDLFVALRGERFDGGEFVVQAIQSGAVAALVDHAQAERIGLAQDADGCPIALLIVPDTRLALGQLAAYWRSQFDLLMVGVTGSNGKTTVKEMLASIFRVAAGDVAAVLSTQGNLNNDIGLPLTLLRLTANHRFAVIEMGMNHTGEIDYLTRIARPQVALITNASGAHLAGLGSVAAVARAKGEIFAGLEEDGIAVIHADDGHADLWRELAGMHTRIEFGLQSDAQVRGTWQSSGVGSLLQVSTLVGTFDLVLQVPGEHNARNALAATAAALALNVSVNDIVEGLQQFGGVAGRLQRSVVQQGVVVIDDTYNANPASVRAAIQVLVQAQGKRILVFGDMGELGEDGAKLHGEVGLFARQAGITQFYALGDLSRYAVKEFGDGAQHFACVEDLVVVLKEQLDKNTTILVKGSRFMKMERVVQALETKMSFS